MGWNFYNASGELLVQHAESEATQAEMEAETAVAHFVPPDLVRNSPGVAKAYCQIAAAGTIVSNSYNVASITDTGTGDRTIVFDTDFGNINYVPANSQFTNNTAAIGYMFLTNVVGSVQLIVRDLDADGVADHASATAFFGDQ